MHSFGWITKAKIGVALVGLLGAACAAQRGTVLLKDGELSYQQQAEPVAALAPAAQAAWSLRWLSAWS